MKKYVFGILAASCITTTSFALNPFQKFSTVPHNNLSAKQHKKTSSDGNYTDFSGTWTGKCSGSDETMTFKIINDEVIFNVDDDITEIGDLQSISNSSQWGTWGFHRTMTWNADKSQLIMSGVSIGKSLYSGEDENNSIFTTIVKSILSINNEQLRVTVDLLNFSGIQETEKQAPIVCTFDRTTG